MYGGFVKTFEVHVDIDDRHCQMGEEYVEDLG
jgi:hypothetical protein